MSGTGPGCQGLKRQRAGVAQRRQRKRVGARSRQASYGASSGDDPGASVCTARETAATTGVRPRTYTRQLVVTRSSGTSRYPPGRRVARARLQQSRVDCGSTTISIETVLNSLGYVCKTTKLKLTSNVLYLLHLNGLLDTQVSLRSDLQGTTSGSGGGARR